MKLYDMKNLISKLNHASNMYYNHTPVITDQEYDLLLKQLQDLETEMNVILSNSPTINVGAKAVDNINTVYHEFPMLSLDKVHTVEEILNFSKGKPIMISIKLDGLSISAKYSDGNLVRLCTRGNGEKGNDITFHASSFKNLPMKIDKSGDYTIAGECLITYDDFELMNSQLTESEKYANPRNLAAGSLALLDPKESKKRNLRFVAWNVLDGESVNEFDSKLNNANIYGFDTVPQIVLTKYTYEDIENALVRIKEMAAEKKYPMDGAVITFVDSAYGKSLGTTSHHPLHSIAYKYEQDKVPTKLLDVEWTMGKTGSLCPTAIFEPVEYDGTIIERASMHNCSVMNMLNPSIGCTCYVYKANSIIPQIHSCDDDGEKEVIIPTQCPECGHPTEIRKDNLSEVLFCTNPSCKGKLLGKLNNFVSKNAMEIKGMSEATLSTLISLKMVSTYKDLYELDTYKTKLSALSGFGKRSVEKMLEAIENSKSVQLENFLAALSIPGIGRSQAKELSKHFNASYDNFIDALENNYDFTCLDGFGTIMNRDLHEWYKTLYYTDEISKLIEYLTFIIPEQTKSDIDLTGKVFVITGSLNRFKNRDELVDIITSFNGKVSGSISSKTTALINNDINSNSSKNNKAKALHIPIMTEDDFINAYGINV